jgi:hypothetical protein
MVWALPDGCGYSHTSLRPFFWDAHLLFDLTAFLSNGFLQCSLQRCREIHRQRLGDSTNEELEISNLAN